MSSVQAINLVNTTSVKKNSKPNYVKWTGYGALALGTASAIAGANKKIKPHKYMAYVAGILAFVHTGLIEWRHYQRKNSVK